MLFGVVIVNYNGVDDLLECLTSIVEAERPTRADIVVVVVDNASTDDSVPRVRKLFPQILVIECERNLGFGGGYNLGSRYVLGQGADVVIMLNSDVVVARTFFRNLEEVLEQEVGTHAISPKILRYYQPRTIESAGGRVSLIRAAPIPNGYGELDSTRFSIGGNTNALAGPAMIVTRELVEQVGLLDESFFFGTEDVDYSLRILRHGVRIMFAPSIQVFHKRARSIRSLQHEGSRVTQISVFFATRNSLLLLSKHGSLIEKVIHVCILLLFTYPMHFMLLAVSGRQMVLRPLLWGLISRLNPNYLEPDDKMVTRLLRGQNTKEPRWTKPRM